MPYIGLRQIGIGIALFGLVAVNLASDVGLMLLVEEKSRGTAWHREAPIGLVLSQLTLLAMWLGLGDGRWYVRLVIAVPLTFALANALGIVKALSSAARRDYDPGNAMLIAFMFLGMLLAIACFGFVLRRTRSWRLTWKQVDSAPAMHQFQIGDALLWMMVLSGALAVVRFLNSIDADFPVLTVALYAVKTTAVVFGAMMVAFATRRKLLTTAVLTSAVLVTGAVFAVPDAYENVQRMRASAAVRSVPMYRYVVAWGNQTLNHEAFVVAAGACAVANCLALRAMGCKFMRPRRSDLSAVSAVPGGV
jgi:hypothetical protein